MRLELRLESWAKIHYKLVVESAQRVADRLLNGPTLSVWIVHAGLSMAQSYAME